MRINKRSYLAQEVSVYGSTMNRSRVKKVELIHLQAVSASSENFANRISSKNSIIAKSIKAHEIETAAYKYSDHQFIFFYNFPVPC